MRITLLVVGVGAMLLGVMALSVGSTWAPDALRFFADHERVQSFELIVSFVPILVIAFGALLVVKSKRV